MISLSRSCHERVPPRPASTMRQRCSRDRDLESRLDVLAWSSVKGRQWCGYQMAKQKTAYENEQANRRGN